MSDFLHGFDPTDIAAETQASELVPFDHNIARCTKGTTYTFENSGDTVLKFEHEITEGPNKGRRATLSFPAAPRLNEKVGAGYVAIDGQPDKAAQATKEWQRAIARIMVAYKLNTPTELSSEWASGAEGAEVVIGAYTDKNGFGAVRCVQNQQRSNYSGKEPFAYAIGLAGAGEPARDRKGVVPGLTRLQQARAAIEKAASK